MNKLTKERARKPLIDTGAAVASQSFSNGVPVFRLDVYPATVGQPSYTLTLTREEMFKAVSTWMAAEARAVSAAIANQGRK